jgi:predicted lysophospholipase L1 biosynthesis ABC-type transport system permease subunit
MRIPLVDGRDFRSEDNYPEVAIVNETFARRYFDGRNPVGQSFEREIDKKRVRTQIIGLVRDARYRDMRETIRPTGYVPVASTNDKGGLRPKDWATFIVRTAAADPISLAQRLRTEVPRARSEFRVVNIRTQEELVRQHTIRERLLATLSLFFAVVALLLAGVGLYGVLYYSVVQRRREIGIRIALGAPVSHLARRVTADVFGMLLVGAGAGLAGGIASEHYISTLLYEVKVRDATMLAMPALTLFAVATLAALPPVIRALRIDPAAALRAD